MVGPLRCTPTCCCMIWATDLTSYGGEGAALPTEWRTTPLIGFRGQLPGHRFLHDGRAATIDEAIRWHGGEAQTSRDAYMSLSASEKLDLTSLLS